MIRISPSSPSSCASSSALLPQLIASSLSLQNDERLLSAIASSRPGGSSTRTSTASAARPLGLFDPARAPENPRQGTERVALAESVAELPAKLRVRTRRPRSLRRGCRSSRRLRHAGQRALRALPDRGRARSEEPCRTGPPLRDVLRATSHARRLPARTRGRPARRRRLRRGGRAARDRARLPAAARRAPAAPHGATPRGGPAPALPRSPGARARGGRQRRPGRGEHAGGETFFETGDLRPGDCLQQPELGLGRDARDHLEQVTRVGGEARGAREHGVSNGVGYAGLGIRHPDC